MSAPATEHLLAVACPACHGALAAPGGAAGTPVRCPLCLATFKVPAPPQAVAEPPRPQAVAGSRVDDPRRRLLAERAARRGRRNIIMLVSGVVILLAIVLLFGSRRPMRRR
ncbi:MAG: hypothetical protein EBR28_13160 [Planctomycetia bacterium]|nr:hypothetical protein [Planctomycetia bacterium]